MATLLGVLGVLGALGAAEHWQRGHELGTMRVCFDPPGIKYVLEPSAADRGRGWQEGAEIPPKTAGVPRIVCLGDSVTFGVNVGARETWCEGVRRGLGGAGAPKVEAFNFGMNGYDAEQVATLLESRIAPYAPDVVVWGTYANDVFPTYLLYGQKSGDPVFVGSDIPPQARIAPERAALFLVRHSALFRRLQGAAYARSERMGGLRRASGGAYGAQVDRVMAWSMAHEVPVVFLAIPPHVMANMPTCPGEFPSAGLCDAAADQHRTVTDTLASRSATWVDALPSFQASGQPHFHPEGRRDPDHPNAAGHRVLAEAVLPAVRRALDGEVMGKVQD